MSPSIAGSWRWPLPRWFVPLMLLAWGVGIGLSVLASGDGVLAGDVRVARWIQTGDGVVPDAVATAGDWAGAYWTGVGVSGLVILAVAWSRRWTGIVLLVLVLLVRALNTTVKGWIDSPRPTPDLVRITEDAEGLGFQSGHASGATLLFGAMAWLAWVSFARGAGRSAMVAACLGVVLIVGRARIYTGAHWPSDVLGGSAFGAAALGSLVLALAHGGRSERTT